MVTREEIDALGIKTMQCMECCRNISKEEYNRNNGYCNTCKRNIEDKKNQYNQENNNDNFSYNENNTKINAVAKAIKILAMLEAIIGIIAGFITIEELEFISVIIIIACVISAIFVYAIGEIIQLLEDIKNKQSKN